MVVVVLTVCIDDVFVDIVKRVRQIRVAEHLGVGLPASPPPWHSTGGGSAKNAACLQRKSPSSNLRDIANEMSEAQNAGHRTTVLLVRTTMMQCNWACRKTKRTQRKLHRPQQN